MTEHSLQEELETRILHGVSCEWERAIWALDPPYRRKMRPPLFTLRDLNGRWGSWNGERREIALSRRLVLDHPWGAVREVLLHEMAHQMAEEVFGARDAQPHGRPFQDACRLLRADPGSVESTRALYGTTAASGEDRILIRVKKLMALASSPDRHEAEAAMAKAHQLIARHNIDLLEGGERRGFVSVLIGAPALRHHAEDYSLANLLQDFYFVRGIWVSSYVLEKRKMGRAFEVSGTLSNVKIAAYVHDFVRRFIHTQWRAYNEGRGLNRSRRTDFS
ncbi:MAG TPA: DUF2786 domain-containing protein, partial [Thermodesulfobacteriota bacterium]|nr:DUF2786 domain-containing protein [Thermodesulfobacteriota bacterium]